MSDIESDLKREESIKKWSAWRFNVRDHFKSMTVDDIREDLKKDQLPCAVLMQNIEGDFNIGNIIRTSNNFNVSEIFYFGKKKYDKRSALGVYNYSKVTYLESFEQVKALKSIYTFIGLENNIDNTTPIKSFIYPKKPIFVMGEENVGITEESSSLIDYFLEIPSRGSVRSLNVGTAAAIVLYDYWSKYNE